VTRTAVATPSSFALILSALVISVVGIACTETRDVRDWRPDDHQQPEGGEIDPSRVPDSDGPPGTDEERAVTALWTVSCASCHGRTGRGDGPGQPPGAQVRDLTDAEWQASVTDEEIAQVITGGRGLMPSFGDRINPRGVEGLVRLIRSLRAE